MAELQSTNITGVLSVNGVAFTGGKDIKYEEFTSSGTFTPTSEAIDGGGLFQVFIVGGGQRGASSTEGGAGGEVVETFVTLTNTTGCAVTIGAGGTSNGAAGGNSVFAGSSAGGVDVTALGGSGGKAPASFLSSGAGGHYAQSSPGATISNPGATIFTPAATLIPSVGPPTFNPQWSYQSAYAYRSAYAYQSAYSSATPAGPGYKGYGAGGRATSGGGGVSTPKANSGAGSAVNINAAAGYCLVVWGE